MKVLVTGGAGYIGSTIASALEDAGHVPVILDDLSVGPRAFVRGRAFFADDVGSRAALERVVKRHPDIACTIHCAARIRVPESVARPALYYRENVAKSLALFTNLAELGLPRVVFSSSASVYAPPTVDPAVTGAGPAAAANAAFEVREDSPLAPASPYARTKQMMEQVLADLSAATPLRALILRYFNPIGADLAYRSGTHDRHPSHVVGKLVEAALGIAPAFQITGTDYPTRDGTGLRDYVHVVDLARAHVAAVERFDAVLATTGATSTVVNLGTGTGVTVRELVDAFRRVWGRPLAVAEAPPRPGDTAGAYANADRAARLLGWHAERSIDDGIASALEWGRRREAILGYR